MSAVVRSTNQRHCGSGWSGLSPIDHTSHAHSSKEPRAWAVGSGTLIKGTLGIGHTQDRRHTHAHAQAHLHAPAHTLGMIPMPMVKHNIPDNI